MRAFYAFTKKEFQEQVSSYRLLIVLVVFFLFGMTSPLLAKLMPEIFAGINTNGMQFIIPEPTILDAYGQFFKNISQIGIFVLLLVFGGTISNELMKGTLINVLAKGLSRRTVILSKYTACVALWSAGFILSSLTAYGYTTYLFKNETVENLLLSLFCIWLFGCFLIALIFLSSMVTVGSFGGLILTAIILATLWAINIVPDIVKYNPATLTTINLPLLDGTQSVKGILSIIIITCLSIAFCLIIATNLFQKKKL